MSSKNNKSKNIFTYTKKTIVTREYEQTITNETYTLRNEIEEQQHFAYMVHKKNQARNHHITSDTPIPISYGAQGIGLKPVDNIYDSSSEDDYASNERGQCIDSEDEGEEDNSKYEVNNFDKQRDSDDDDSNEKENDNVPCGGFMGGVLIAVNSDSSDSDVQVEEFSDDYNENEDTYGYNNDANSDNDDNDSSDNGYSSDDSY
ncbi:hypothetical protein HANVADRAFT_52388 [Hanseniaspora valbyensis NRRL Y-1626]|uniref:Transcription factor Iwr1 domain-containing protein n=1 Tax=Hanseniaspora valbyensis NRRL Y-1626 TaxID=766949 RepID=A0A1B7TF59_9ASCO|nr:hypothetical protein HANVADRAFT_52388 [Hanseniaspora valbyensis NRRL Y-1626]